ncbi:MAG TPA: NAD(P)H-dependent glycerol-3-phosphate dehydrogenase, partial [Pyrinomonadaceae bacterium]
MKRIAVIGAGSWGTALGILASRSGNSIRMWARSESVVRMINCDHLNSAYLPGVSLPEQVTATTEFNHALEDADLVILAAPSHATRLILELMAAHLPSKTIIVSATKGIEVETGKRISEVVTEVLGEAYSNTFVCISGPSFAKEVVTGHPTAIVAAGADPASNALVQSVLSFENLRLYTNDDLIGTELGGSVKNVMAIAAGIVAGLGFGSNSIAALITRGLAETTRLAIMAGARIETLMGLAGLGDLVLTCTGDLSRNRFIGQELGRGRRLNDIVAGMNEVAEGVKTTNAVRTLARRLDVEMPITEEVYRVLYEGKAP